MFALKEFNLDHLVLLFILNSSPTPKYILQGISTSIATREMPLTFKIFQIFQPQDPEKKWIKERNNWIQSLYFYFLQFCCRPLKDPEWNFLDSYSSSHSAKRLFPSVKSLAFILPCFKKLSNKREDIFYKLFWQRKDFLYSGDCQQYIADSISLCFQQTSTNIQRICP